MKKPIKKSHLFALLAFAFFPFVLLFFDYTPVKYRQQFNDEAVEQGKLQLSGKLIHQIKAVRPFEYLNIRTKFIDSLVLIPSQKPFVKISGDQILIENLQIKMDQQPSRLSIWSKNLSSRVDTSASGLKKINLIIGYQSLTSVKSYFPVQTFIQKGVLEGHRVKIDLEAEEASVQVKTNYLDVRLSKPEKIWVGDTVSSDQYQQYVQELKKSPMHQIRGKADLVNFSSHFTAHFYTDLRQLECRQVHMDLQTSTYNKIIARPSQLFSYITPEKGRFFFANELICESKAKTIRAYKTTKGIVRYR